MSQEKTEQPTEKKLRESRKKGQVAKSADLTQATLFLAAGAALQMSGAHLVGTLAGIMRQSFRPEIFRADYGFAEMYAWPLESAKAAALALAPTLGSVMLLAAAVNFLQVRGLFSLEIVKPKFSKLNPLEGFKNIFFKAKTYVELAKNLLKVAIVAALAWHGVNGLLRDIASSGHVNPVTTAQLAGAAMFRLLYQCGAAFLAIGAADFLLQKKFLMKELMMSKEEVKREYKEDEGDPHVKHRRKELHHELLQESEMHNVSNASAVVVNPVHIAVAIAYDDAAMNAPRVTARGRELRAQAIKDLARKSNVPVIENVPLARSLIQVETGHEIPEELYEPVAEILQFVYELQAEREKKPQ